MTKQTKQRIHRKFMQNGFHSMLNRIGVSYYNFGTTPNVGYWFQCDKITDEQKQVILESHPKSELVKFLGSRKQFAPEIKSSIILLSY